MNIILFALTTLAISQAAFADTSGAKTAFDCTCLAPDGSYDVNGIPNYKTLGTLRLQSKDSDEAEYFARKTCIATYRNTEAFSMCDFAK
jgi:hypothetical protein